MATPPAFIPFTATSISVPNAGCVAGYPNGHGRAKEGMGGGSGGFELSSALLAGSGAGLALLKLRSNAAPASRLPAGGPGAALSAVLLVAVTAAAAATSAAAGAMAWGRSSQFS